MNSTVDFTGSLSSVSSAVSTQLSSALPYGLYIGGGLVAVFLAWKVIKRFIKG